MIPALYALVGGIGGAMRMLMAGVLVTMIGFVYVTVWMIPRAADAARQGYVLQVTADTATAKTTELERQLSVQQILSDAYAANNNELVQKQAAQDAETEKAIALNENERRAEGRACPLTSGDLDFLRK